MSRQMLLNVTSNPDDFRGGACVHFVFRSPSGKRGEVQGEFMNTAREYFRPFFSEPPCRCCQRFRILLCL
jgi:hypothetical protein